MKMFLATPVPLGEVCWLDLETGAHTTLASGAIEMLGETTFDDQWLLGAKRFRGQDPEFVTVRIGIRPKPVVEKLRQTVGAQLLPNPRHRPHPQKPRLPSRV